MREKTLGIGVVLNSEGDSDDSEETVGGRVPYFDHESRIDYRDKNEFMMGDLDAREALGDGSGTEQQRPIDGEETVGGRVPPFDHKSRINYRDRNEHMMSDLDVREALRDGSGTE